MAIESLAPMASHDRVLPEAFYDRPVLQVARDLLGCAFFHEGAGGVIVETEAYAHDDPCCHGFRGRTARNAVMFGPPGHLYVYFTYGMHFCANLVCEEEGRAAAVLLRALEPTAHLAVMARRRGVDSSDPRALCSGPAKLTQALGLGREQNGLPAWRAPVIVTARPGADPTDVRSWSRGAPETTATTRIGVGGDDRLWRFIAAGSRFLSRPAPRRPG